MIPSLNPTIVGQMPLEEFVRTAGRVGYGGADLNIHAAAEMAERKGVEAVRKLFDSAGVRPAAFGLPVDFRASEERFQAGLAELPALCELAVALDCPRTCTWIMPGSDELDYEENMAFHVSRLRPVMDILRDHGVRFGIEFVAPAHVRQGKKYEFIHTIAGALELADRLGEGAGLLLDSFHWFTSGATVDDLLALGRERIVHVHVNDAPDRPLAEQRDNERLLPGEGVIDLRGFLGALKQMGYRDFLSIEVLGPRPKEFEPEQAARRCLAGLHAILGQL